MSVIRAWRKAHGLTLAQLAGRIGKDPATLSRYESGARFPSDRETLLKIHAATGLTPNDIYDVPAKERRAAA